MEKSMTKLESAETIVKEYGRCGSVVCNDCFLDDIDCCRSAADKYEHRYPMRVDMAKKFLTKYEKIQTWKNL